MRKLLFSSICGFIILLTGPAIAGGGPTVFFGNGVKIGEVKQTSAIVWTRLTASPEMNWTGANFITTDDKLASMQQQLPQGSSLGDMEGAMPGKMGKVRLSWQSVSGKKQSTDWEWVAGKANFTRKFWLSDLDPGTEYTLILESMDGHDHPGQTLTAHFRTAPERQTVAPVRFTVVTGQDYPRRDDKILGHKIYPHILALEPDFFVHTGDIEYYDKPDPWATNLELARFKWDRVYALPNQREFHQQVASYFIKDDHDTLKNDSWPGQSYGELTWEQGLALFPENFPVTKKNYRTIRWGRDLQIWLVEGRDFRSPNTQPDGPEKTIWGEEQKEWFFRTVDVSDATFRIFFSPTPLVGPDRGSKNDNHANEGFTHEGDQLRDFISARKNMYVVCGDRHWQYVSVDPRTGVREYSCGPTSDVHAGGFKKSDESDMHHYLNIVGGFLSVEIDRINGNPVAIFRHHSVDGEVLNEDIRYAD